jgi:hypothetical protein
MTPISKKKPAPKKPAAIKALEQSVAEVAEDIRHMKAVLNRRLNFDISTEPEDIVVPEADES